MTHANPKASSKWFLQLFDDYLKEEDLEYNLELLSFMAETGSPQLFRHLIQETLPLLETEEDFRDLLFISVDYYHRLDQESLENAIQNMIGKRSKKSLQDVFHPADSDLPIFMNLLDSKSL